MGLNNSGYDSGGPTIPRWLKIGFYGTLTVLAGIANNITFFEMGQKMELYPVFLLYFSTMLYVTLYGLASVVKVATAIRKPYSTGGFVHNFLVPQHQKRLFALGVWLIINGLFSQFSNPYVDGNLQGVLYQMALPTTGILAWWMLKKRFSVLNLCGSFLVVGGCLLVALPPFLDEKSGNSTAPTSPSTTTTLGPTGTSLEQAVDAMKLGTAHGGAMWIWTIVFALSVIPNGVIAVVQERMFEEAPDLDPILVLFWSNLYTLFGYLLAVPLTMLPYLGNMTGPEIAVNQRDAFRCIAGNPPLPPGCKEHAIVPVLLFTVAYMLFFYFLALLVKEVGAVFEALVNGIVTPANALALSFSWLMGEDVEPLTNWVIAGSVVVPLGIFLYEGRSLIHFFRGEKTRVTDDQEPLLGAPKKNGNVQRSKS